MYKSSNGRFHLNSLTLALFVSLVFVEVFKREYDKRKENSYVKPTKIVKVRKTLIYEIKTCTKEIYC